MNVRTGLDIFLSESGRYAKRSIALIANQTSITPSLEYSWRAFSRLGLRLRRVFSPEHGLYGTEQDQVPVAGQPGAGPEIISLYGDSINSLRPLEEVLDGIDTVIFDIQDVGSRYYTYVNTMAMFMESVSGRDLEFVVLDRPNPIGGLAVEGPSLGPGFESFVGVFHLPVRHGLTAGELALWYRKRHRLDVNLKITRMMGWRRSMLYAKTGLPWVAPSPNMPTPGTALVYPGMCLLEGTTLSEGRGSTTPFEICGAPFIEPEEYAAMLNAQNIPGVRFRPTYFRPTFNKFAGRTVGGVFLHLSDPGSFRPFLAGVAVVWAARRLYGDGCGFPHGVYEFNSGRPAFDLLAGNDALRGMIEAGADLKAIAASWASEEDEFRDQANAHQLYD